MTASGFYHCSVKGVGRSNGRSIVAAAAYRSGERLVDEITGQVADYRAKGGILDTFILAPANAPEWAASRERLWNEAERAETRANGRLATELELALPHELTDAARKELLQAFVGRIVQRYGVAADVAIHEPGEGRDHRNIHAHVLITHREVGPEGFGEIANRRIVPKRVKGEEKDVEIAGLAATPADIRALRQEWEQATNRAYERAGLDIRVDHRSHQERGIDQEPTQHLGPTAAEMERRGAESLRGDANREITQRNAERRVLATLETEATALKAEIAEIQGQERRYDPVRDSERSAQRSAFDGRYDDLRAAEPQPETMREFLSAAARAAEQSAVYFDRDAAEAAWTEKLNEAAIAQSEAAEKTSKVREGHDASEWKEARGRGGKPLESPHNVAAQEIQPGTKTAGEIRLAWNLTRGANEDLRRDDHELETALVARGIYLAEVTVEEAQQSVRTAAFAKEVGNFAKVWREHEIVAVDGWGNAHRFDERSTGDLQAEIEARLAGVDRSTLLNLATTQEIARTAAYEAWIAKQPPTALEARIIECAEQARLYGAVIEREKEGQHRISRGEAFAARFDEKRAGEIETATVRGPDAMAARLEEAGIAIVRLTAHDASVLQDLRYDEKLDRLVADSNREVRKNHHFAELEEGELAAVTRGGDVHRIAAVKLRGIEIPAELPSMYQARAAFQAEREYRSEFWADHNATKMAERETAATAHKHHAPTTTPTRDTPLRVRGKALHAAVKVFETGFNLMFGWAMAPPKLTAQQARDKAQADGNEETLHAHAVAAAASAKEVAWDWEQHAEKTARQENDLRLAQTLGIPLTAEATLGRDHDRNREQERER